MNDEVILILLGLAAVAWILIGPILVFMLTGRVRRLEDEVRHLRRDAASWQQLESIELPSRPVEQVAPAATPTVAEPPPLPIPTVTPFPMRPVAAVTTTAPQTPTARPISWEEILAGRWLTWVGAVAIVIAAALFFKYAIDNNWIGPTARVMIGLLAGMATFAGGAFAMIRNYRLLAQGMAGAALGILYASLFASFQWYDLVPREAAFAGMIAVTALALAFSVVFDAQATAILGLLGGFATPIMLSTDVDTQVTLFTYLLILDLGVLGIATFRKWQPLQLLALAGTVLMWCGWFYQHYTPETLVTTSVLLTLFFLLFALLGVWHNVLRRQPAVPADFALILATPVLYFLGLYGITYDKYFYLHGLLAVALGGVYLGLGAMALARHPRGSAIVLALCGIAAAFLTLAIPLQLTGHWIVIAWALEALLLVEIGLRFGEPRLRWAGLALLTVVQFLLMSYAAETIANPRTFETRFTRPAPVVQYEDRFGQPIVVASPASIEPQWTDVFNGRSFSFLASAVVLGVLAWEYRRRGATLETGARVDHIRPTAAQDLLTALIALVPLSFLGLLGLETFALAKRESWLNDTLFGWLAVWTALAAVALVACAVHFAIRSLRVVAGFVFGLLALLVFVLVVTTFDSVPGHVEGASGFWLIPFFNPRAAGLLAAVAAAAVALNLVMRDRTDAAARAETSPPAEWYANLPALLGVFTYFTVLVLLTLELYAFAVLRDWRNPALAISLLWLAYAVATLILGILRQWAAVRVLALGLFVLTTLKVFLYDTREVEAAVRTISFLALGVCLLFVSYLYRRYRERIRQWMAPTLLLAAGLASPDVAMASDSAASMLERSLKARFPIALDAAASTGGNRELRRLVLTPEVYAVARPDLGDLRVLAVDKTGDDVTEIPYLLRQQSDSSTRKIRPAPLLDLSQREGHTEFLLDLSAAVEPVSELVIEVNADQTNYERNVSIFGADRRDAPTWNQLADDGYVLDHTRGSNRLTVNRVEFPQSRFRFYKVRIDNAGRPPLKIVGAKLYDRALVRAPRTTFPAKIAAQEITRDRKSQLTFDLGSARFRSVALRLSLAYDGDYHRSATLEAADELGPRPPWRLVTRGHVYRVDRGNIKANNQTLAYPQASARYLRLSIENNDDRPLEVTDAKVDSNPEELIVALGDLKRSAHPAYVYAGAELLAAPSYDLAHTLSDADWQAAPALQIGPREENARFQVPQPILPWSEANKVLLWSLTLGGVVLLGFLTLVLMRKAAAVHRNGELS